MNCLDPIKDWVIGFRFQPLRPLATMFLLTWLSVHRFGSVSWLLPATSPKTWPGNYPGSQGRSFDFWFYRQTRLRFYPSWRDL